MATTYHDTDFLAWALQARTDDESSPGEVDDTTGEDARVLLEMFTEGVVSGLEVSQRAAGANMSVDVALGSAVIEGANTDQGKYLAKIAGVNAVNVTLDAASAVNPRIDEIYLVVLDDGYDSSGFVLPRIAVRDGTPASSPSAPGPDAAWDAYLLIASVAVVQNETQIEDEHITDERLPAALVDDLVATDSIQDEAVTEAKIADGAVAAAKLAAGAISDFVKAGGEQEVTTPANLTTSFVDKASVVFTKPAEWGNFFIMAWGTGVGLAIGGAPLARVEIGGSNGATVGSIASAASVLTCFHSVASTSTSPLTIALAMAEVSGDAQWHAATISYLAIRLS